MNKKPKKSTLEANALKIALEELIFNANRVDSKYGHDDCGQPSDYTEWTDLRNSIMKAKHLINRK